LFGSGTASLKPQHLRTMTLITQHKPIERSTDMVIMTKTSQIQAWLNGFYMESLYWAAHDFKACSCTAASRRPGTRDDKTQANLAPPLAQRAYGAVVSVNQNQT